MSKLENGLNKKFGRLLVKEIIREKGRPAKYRCICDCGKEVITQYNNLYIGKTLSCGCLNNEQRHKKGKKHYIKHGKTGSRILMLRNSMISRCYSKSSTSYKNYGGRGIGICDEWLNKKNGAENFIKWAYSNGYDEQAEYGECTIDRIDVNKGYSPDNCRFISMKEQMKNKRPYNYDTQQKYALFNRELQLALKNKGICFVTIRERMKKYGITFEEAINYKKFSKMPIVNKYKKQYTNRKKIEEERQKMIEYVNKI